jgi:hypothetical protein
VRGLTITTLGMRLTASYRWCMVSQGASRGTPDSLTKDCKIRSRSEEFWEPPGGRLRGGNLPCV